MLPPLIAGGGSIMFIPYTCHGIRNKHKHHFLLYSDLLEPDNISVGRLVASGNSEGVINISSRDQYVIQCDRVHCRWCLLHQRQSQRASRVSLATSRHPNVYIIPVTVADSLPKLKFRWSSLCPCITLYQLNGNISTLHII